MVQLNRHPEFEGRHARLSASKYHWINYSPEKFREQYTGDIMNIKGTRLHAVACELIKLREKMPRSNRTLNAYVNDSIGFRMSPEVVLAYSEFSFGTADALGFRDKFLRIHDLKTGTTRASFKQLYVYAALFCLEYNFKPTEIGFEFRIYQHDTVYIETNSENERLDEWPRVDRAEIIRIMDKIVFFDNMIREMRAEAFDE